MTNQQREDLDARLALLHEDELARLEADLLAKGVSADNVQAALDTAQR